MRVLAINDGRFVDLIEVDAASRTRVDDTRELMENTQYTPAQGRFKVYLIDEVHMLSNHSFNALLKTLEEPPPHIKFLLATTDPQKLPVTVLSRCLQFNLKRLTVAEIGLQLEKICREEGFEAESEGVEVARQGGRRQHARRSQSPGPGDRVQRRGRHCGSRQRDARQHRPAARRPGLFRRSRLTMGQRYSMKSPRWMSRRPITVPCSMS